MVRALGLHAPGSNPVLTASLGYFRFRLSRIQLYQPVEGLNHVSVKFELLLSDYLKVGTCKLA